MAKSLAHAARAIAEKVDSLTWPGLDQVRRRSPSRLLVGAGALLVLLGLAVIALLEGDFPDFFDVASLGALVRGKGYLGAVALLYLEESGVPMPVPGDFFVMYVGSRTNGRPLLLVVAWLALTATVVLGSTNLYLLSRRFGRKWVEGWLGTLTHVTPERLARAEQIFRRWGVPAIIFGRHVPGLRIPITVAAGTLRTPYPLFASSVAISSAIWAGVFLLLGVKVGARVGDALQAHRGSYVLVAAAVAAVFGYFIFRLARGVWRSGRH